MYTKDVKCFISYAQEDKRMFERFFTHFNALKKLYNITCWYNGMIPVGGEIDKEILRNLSDSDIIFLLISQDYISSYQCFENELKIAIDRHNEKKCIVIPVFIRSFVSGEYPFSKLKYIPTNGKPIDKFHPQNDGFVNAFTGIKNLLEDFKKNKKESIDTSFSNGSQKNSDTTEENMTPAKYMIVKNGEISYTVLHQKDLESFIKYSVQLPLIMKEFTNLIDNQLSHFSTVVSKKDAPATVLAHGKNDMESFLLQLFSYIQHRFIGTKNTCVHFRVKEGKFYKTFSEIGYPIVGLKTEPISCSNSIIGYSKLFDIPVLKEYNEELHKKAHPKEKINRNYITFTFNDIYRQYDVDISMCISIVGDEKNEIFVPMSVLRFDKIIEYYLIRYISFCEKINSNYKVKDVLIGGGK